MIQIGVIEIGMKEIKNKLKRNRIHVIVIAFFIALWIFIFISIDWDEVNEYEKQWGGKMTGICHPSPPYMFEKMLLIMIPMIIFMYIVVGIRTLIFR